MHALGYNGMLSCFYLVVRLVETLESTVSSVNSTPSVLRVTSMLPALRPRSHSHITTIITVREQMATNISMTRIAAREPMQVESPEA